MDDLIQQGANAFKSGDRETARKLLISAVKQYPDNERAWGWMYSVCNTDQERIHCLKQILRINPSNQKASQTLGEMTKSISPSVSSKTEIGNQNIARQNVSVSHGDKNKAITKNKGMATEVYLIALAIFICVVFSGLGAWYYNDGPCGKRKVEQAVIQMDDLLNKWIDAENIAGSSPRISLASPISNLQSVRTELSNLEVPVCMEAPKSELLLGMETSIQGYIAFLGQESDYTVSTYFDEAATHIKNFTDLMKEVQSCAPFCQQ
ncbi:MAG: hypothetical protein HS124_06860 [Anaerolineales bacterium]|nr:hypothetical protein [Anaerolineales bacterium]